MDLEYKIAVVVDRDDRETAEIEQYFSHHLRPCIGSVINRAWTSTSFHNKFGQEAVVHSLCVIIPQEEQGALETLLLAALSENSYKKTIINKSKAFVEAIVPDASQIITTDRLRLKTKLGVSLAILYPEKVFSLIDEQLKSVPWEKSRILSESFAQLLEI